MSQQQKQKTFIFDLGGVFLEDNLRIGMKPVAKRYGIPFEVIADAYYGRPWQQFMRGRITPVEFYNIINQRVGKSGIAQAVLKETKKRVQIFLQTLALVRQLRQRGHRLILFTDSTPDWISYWRRQLGLNRIFHHQFVSSQFGLRKSSSRFYALIFRSCKLVPKDTVWIDDREKNLLIPKARGVQTILYKNESQLIRALNMHV